MAPKKENKANKYRDAPPYTDEYYSSGYEEGSRLSARVIVPLVMELAQPRSVVDVGCGTGEWLAVFRENGIKDTWGVDGTYINKKLLKIPEECFIPANL